jgi:hypothetical protein
MDVKALQSPRCSIGPRKPSCTCLAEAGQAYYIPRLQSDQSCSLFETHTRLPEALAREQELGYAMQVGCAWLLAIRSEIIHFLLIA